MKTFTPVTHATALAALAVLVAAGCSDDSSATTDAGDTLARYGDACKADADCATGLCALDVCTVECTRLADCPSVQGKHFDCGEVATGKVACYPQTYDTKAGTTGDDCSTTSCASGYLCTGIAGDADRYCAGKCTTDRDCPPQYRCVTTQTGTKAPATTKYCLRRELCHPCVIDDQCGGPADRCLEDKYGNGYCAAACTPPADAGVASDAGTSGSCPASASCVAVSGGAPQCEPKAGYCYSFKGDGAQCAPCITHGWSPTGTPSDPAAAITEPGQCKTGAVCTLVDRFTQESACLEPCDSSGNCPTGYGCVNRTLSAGTKLCVPVVQDSTGQYAIGSCF